MTTSKKITKTTVKSFINKNRKDLYINTKSRFDGMTDGIESLNGGMAKAKETQDYLEHTMGIEGAWFTTSSKNYVYEYESPIMVGYEVSNCCGRFVVAISKFKKA